MIHGEGLLTEPCHPTILARRANGVKRFKEGSLRGGGGGSYIKEALQLYSDCSINQYYLT